MTSSSALLPLKKSMVKMFKLVSFRLSRSEMVFNKTDLYLGLIITWIVGIGRYWDSPDAEIIQRFGVGSLAYVYVLSGFLWVVFKPLKINNCSYFNLRTFIVLTSLPAILYSIPVERFLSIQMASLVNVYFLLIVATWRVSLLIYFLKNFANMSNFEVMVSTLLPLTFIVNVLSFLNLEKATFNIMGGLRETAHDKAYIILLALTVVSFIAFIPLILCYLWIVRKKIKTNFGQSYSSQ